MTIQDTKTIDTAKLEAFIGKAVDDWGATLSCALVVIGDKLGLYRAMAGAGPLTPAELAGRTGTSERYVRDWLVNQAGGGYIDYDTATGRYTLPDEHALVLTDETSPFFVAGGFSAATAMVKAGSRITEAFRTGDGMLWGEHGPDLFYGTERFFRAGYAANLVSAWIPALDGVEAKLKEGATVADVGCGHGASTIIMAWAYPNSRFFGFDNHAPSISRAREASREAGVADRITFEMADASDYPGPLSGYDLVAFFDGLHDMGDPIRAARHAHETLASEGTMLMVEPMAGEQVEENLNPVGRIFSGASVLLCMPNTLASGGPESPALGAIATKKALREVVTAGGFTRFRRTTETPFNRVFEAWP